MFQKIKKYSISFLPVIVATLLIVSIAYAWTEPTFGPPEGNVDAPVNVGTDDQTFTGSKKLNVGSLGAGVLTIGGGLNVRGVGTFVGELNLNTSGIEHRILSAGVVDGIGSVTIGSKPVHGALTINSKTSKDYPALQINEIAGSYPNKYIANRLIFYSSLPNNDAMNGLVEGGDMALIYDQKTVADTGTLVIGPHSSYNKGLKIGSNGYVGVNTPNPTGVLHVVRPDTIDTTYKEPAIIASSVIEGVGGHIGFFPRLDVDSWNPMVEANDSAIIFGYNDNTNGGAFEEGINNGSLVIGQWSGSPRGIRIGSDGIVEIGSKIKINGGSPGNGKILVSDANGLASWVSRDWERKVVSDASSVTVSCSSGKKVLGGGCETSGSSISKNYPISDSSWRCDSTDSGAAINVYIICARE